MSRRNKRLPGGSRPVVAPAGRARRGFGILVLGLVAGGLSTVTTASAFAQGESCEYSSATGDPVSVTTSGRHLLVDGERFVIRGVCYNPVPVGSSTRSWNSLEEDILLMQAAGINTLRVYSPIAERWVLDQLAAAGLKVIMGFTANTGAFSIASGGYLTYVETFKNHPAILLWELGNEYNYHPEWFGGNVDAWYDMLEDAAQQIHLVDLDHPVSTAHGEAPTAAVLARVPSVDVWGMNVYRWDWSYTAVTDFAARSDRPCYLSEAGADSYNSAPDHPTYPFGPNEPMQADAVAAILEGVLDHLDVGSGVTLFELTDEWWKAGDPWTQDPGGAAPNSSGVPYDGAPNEEYWGLVDVLRVPKLAFDVVASAYSGTLCLVSAHAGTDQYLPVGTTSTVLDGSASRHTGPLTFAWRQTAGPTTAVFASTDAEQPEVADLAAGTYVFSVTVSGDCGSSTDTVRVTVLATANLAPIAEAGPDQIVDAGTSTTALDGSASFDPDGGPAALSFLWTQTAGPALRLSSRTLPSPLVAGVSEGESYTFELVVSDGLDRSTPSRATLYGAPVFVDGFESGDTVGWSVTVPGPGKSLRASSRPKLPSPNPQASSSVHPWARHQRRDAATAVAEPQPMSPPPAGASGVHCASETRRTSCSGS